MTKILHTGIVVRNMVESLKFYTEVLQFTKVGEQELPGVTLVFLAGENQGLELLAYANETEDRTEGIISHFAVEVDDMKQAIAQLKEMQIPLETEEPRDAMGKKIFFFTGPNGEKIEMVQEAK